MKAENEGFQTTVKSSKTGRYIVNYGYGVKRRCVMFYELSSMYYELLCIGKQHPDHTMMPYTPWKWTRQNVAWNVRVGKHPPGSTDAAALASRRTHEIRFHILQRPFSSVAVNLGRLPYLNRRTCKTPAARLSNTNGAPCPEGSPKPRGSTGGQGCYTKRRRRS